MHAAAASVVELRGDGTEWRAWPAEFVENHDYAVHVPLGIAMQRLQWRIDGGRWQPLPGWPVALDDFGDEVSVIWREQVPACGDEGSS